MQDLHFISVSPDPYFLILFCPVLKYFNDTLLFDTTGQLRMPHVRMTTLLVFIF